MALINSWKLWNNHYIDNNHKELQQIHKDKFSRIMNILETKPKCLTTKSVKNDVCKPLSRVHNSDDDKEDEDDDEKMISAHSNPNDSCCFYSQNIVSETVKRTECLIDDTTSLLPKYSYCHNSDCQRFTSKRYLSRAREYQHRHQRQSHRKQEPTLMSTFTLTNSADLFARYYTLVGRFVSTSLCLLLLITLLPTVSGAAQHAKQVATIPGQLVIGALLSIREQPTLRAAATRTCGEVREQYGIHRVEAAFQTIDAINRDENILPNITLGIEIRDSCWYSAIALEQSIEFIRDAMAASEEKAIADSSRLDQSTGVSIFSPTHHIPGTYANSDFEDPDSFSPGRILGLFPASPFNRSSAAFNVSTPCPKAAKKAKNIVGVIGPASSTNSIQVQNLLQLFNIPQIGYSATSKELSAKNFFKFFLRVVPSDYHQAQVMTSLFRYYNWTYVSVIYTDGSYGSGLMEIFKTNAQESGICIAYMESIPANGDDETFDNVINSLLAYRNAKVVACFCEGSSARALLQAKKRLNITTEFLLVGSDGWSDRPDVVKGLEKEAQGSLTVRIYSAYIQEFDNAFFDLDPIKNVRNPWFREFWEAKMNCSLRKLTNQVIHHPNNITFTRDCTGDERLSDFTTWRRPRYKQDNKMSFVVKAIWTMAHALDNMQKAICKNVTGLCSEMLPVNGSILLQHLNHVQFKWKNEWVQFDENGDPPGRYDIMNYQELKRGEYDYVQVGDWKSGNKNSFNINHDIQWPREREIVLQTNFTEIKVLNKHFAVPESVCSKPCPRGQAKNIQSDSVKCCWICVPCRENEYLTAEEKCLPCKIGTWPNEALTGCTPIPVEFIHWTDTSSLVAMSISFLGLLMTLFAMIVFIRANNTPVVKASTRELSYMILFGMLLCHCTTFFLVAKPTKLTCYVTRILPGLAFAIIYSSLVTKTNRIARILAGSKKRIITKKPRFMSGTAQVVITWLLISVEVGIIVTVLIREPADKMLKYPTLERVVLTCNTKVLGISAPLGFDFVLIGFCTLYAIKTRNVPENFNEAKFIGFTMYTTLVIWCAFVPIYYNSDENVITLSLCITFSAIVALVLLFFPKLYIILFKPEKNNRSYFTTAKNVRCHIGYAMPPPTSATFSSSSIGGAASRHSSHSVSDLADSPRQQSLQHPSLEFSGKKLDVATIQNPYGGYITGLAQNGRTRRELPPTRPRPKRGFFSRLFFHKQDKIAANVQEHIRAVRAAEELDRQTARKGRFNASQSFSERPTNELAPKNSICGTHTAASRPTGASSDDAVTLLSRQDTQTRRLRIVQLLRRTFGDELERVPQFGAIVNCLKNEYSGHIYSEASTQTPVPSEGYHSTLARSNAIAGSQLRHRRPTGEFELFDDDEPGPQQVCRTFSSSESVLSAAGSMVVEENASEASEPSSADSGVYKNIIINLGSLTSPLNTPSGRGSTISAAYSRPAPVPSGYFYGSSSSTTGVPQYSNISGSGPLAHYSGHHPQGPNSQYSGYSGSVPGISGNNTSHNRYMTLNNAPGTSSSAVNSNSELVGILKKSR